MENPVRIILKSTKTDSNGQLIDSEYKTVDINNEELESLMFGKDASFRSKFQVVGAELLNESKLTKKHREELLTMFETKL
jgi:hypothetical protein